jgi:hypothetical protein
MTLTVRQTAANRQSMNETGPVDGLDQGQFGIGLGDSASHSDDKSINLASAALPPTGDAERGVEEEEESVSEPPEPATPDQHESGLFPSEPQTDDLFGEMRDAPGDPIVTKRMPPFVQFCEMIRMPHCEP